MDTPVLVAGGGPTGLTAALELSRMGIPVRVIDKVLECSAISAPVALQPRTLDLLDRRGLRLWTLPKGYPVAEAAVYANGGLRGRVGLAADFSREPDLVLPRADLVRRLSEQLARSGAEVEHGTELVEVSQPSPDRPPDPRWPGVRAVLKRPDGSLEQMTTPYLIAAHGSQPTARGLPECTTRRRRSGCGYVLADLWLDGDLSGHEFSVLLGKHGFLTALPLGGGRFWCVATDPERRSGGGRPTTAEIQQIIDACSPIPVRLAALTFSARVPAGSRAQPRLQHGRVFFGGTSGCPTQPAAAWWVNTGIQDMINLGWKLAMVLRGTAVPDLLTTYVPERVEAIREVRNRMESAAHVLGSRSAVVHQLVTRFAPALFDANFVLSLCADLAGEVVPAYRASQLSAPPHGSAGLQPGDSEPDVEVLASAIGAGAAGRPQVARLPELVDPSRLTLLVVPDATGARPPGLDELISRWQATVAAYTIAPRPGHPDDLGFFSAFGGRGLLLLRPDGYVAFASRLTALPELVTWLSRWFPSAPPGGTASGRGLAATRT